MKDKLTDEYGDWVKMNKQSQPELMVCSCCGRHHFHIIRINRVRYAQCGDCKEMSRL